MSAVIKPESKAPFVTGLRSRKGTIDLSRKGEPSITVRVEMAEVWDTVRIAVSASEPVMSVKRAALEALAPDAGLPAEFVIKLRGWEILDENESLSGAGAIDGSIFLLTYRRRRAVK
jgi:hypothetical protein